MGDAELDELRENERFMRRKLAETRRKIGKSVPAITVSVGEKNPHDVLRTNPLFDGYNRLLASYRATVAQIAEMDGGESGGHAGDDGGEDILKLVSARRDAATG